ncbi:hypothetical protein GCM10011351_17170 [Paraliobacillus quinghaiensis]|uniref:Uncharacterized protein n=1 Tax=Paraliobacillus quinghaiensis TaxID=470815 RepID=A0A917WV48_9BACI|nr:hypothetical protein [Paraliobacillus quinghaiensis]GGM31564.1 hypothetical protein GCM10011351_17170 [Paraliobacillus quinghaiensis]
MRYIALCFTTILLIVIFFLHIQNVPTKTTIKYFPPDESITFQTAFTKLQLLMEKDQDSYTIEWRSYSETDEPTYLRQDISLLYVDGLLKGVKSEWQEEVSRIELDTTLYGEDSSHYQAISYHHAEVHHPEDKIKSVQKMSHDELYVIDSTNTPLESFKTPTNDTQTEWQHALNHTKTQQLHYHWQQLINHFQLASSDFLFVPLSKLYQYETSPFPTLTQDQTAKVIGQLWEGLYANYILPFNQADPSSKSLIPLILVDKEGTHLRVLFQDHNGKMQQLIQRYSFPSNS